MTNHDVEPLWPGDEWSSADVSESAVVRRESDELFAGGATPADGRGVSLALAVIHRGRLVFERYGVQPDTIFGPGGPVGPDTTLVSWSMAKSVTHALVGMLVDEGRLDPNSPAAVTDWRGDGRSAITLDHLLRMRDGLEFVEEYVDTPGARTPDVISMLFAEGAADVAAYARARPPKHAPGEVWNYSSGTTNVISRLVGDVVGHGEAMDDFIRRRLFAPLGMKSATARFDDAGTFIGSSYVYATARDFARFGYLYLRDGVWNGNRLLSSPWIDGAVEQHATDPETQHGYGRHWWIWKSRPGVLAALGYEGQRIIVDRSRDLVVVHLGKWVADTQPVLDAHLSRVVDAFPLVAG